MASSDSVDYRNNLMTEHEKAIDSWMKGRSYLRPYLNDEVVVSVLERIKERADEGMEKYGVPMTRDDVTTIQWLRHAQEEALDLAIYLERIIRDFTTAKEAKTNG